MCYAYPVPYRSLALLFDSRRRRRRFVPHLFSQAVYGGTAEQLKAYSVSVVPPKSDWVPLGDGVLFFQVKNRDSRFIAVWALVFGAQKTVLVMRLCVVPASFVVCVA